MSIRDDLKAFIDGELSQERAAEVRTALETDPSLKHEHDFLVALSGEIREVCREPAVQGYEKTMDAVRRETRPRLFNMRPLQLAGALALMVVVAAITFPVFQRGSAQDEAAVSVEPPATEEKSNPTAGGASAEGLDFRAKAESQLMDGAKGPGSPQQPQRAQAASSSPAPADAVANGVATDASRMVVRNGTVSVKVNDAERAAADAKALVKSYRGFVENDSSSRTADSRSTPTAYLTLRIPVQHFDTVLAQLLEMGELLDRNVTGEDVTTQHADVTARLKILRGEEQQYLSILAHTRRIGEVLAVKERLSQVRQQIESLDAQRKTLSNLSSLATIHVSFVQRERVGEPEPPENWAEEAWAVAVNGLSSAGRFLGRGLITLFVFAPIWLPIAILLAWLSRKARRP